MPIVGAVGVLFEVLALVEDLFVGPVAVLVCGVFVSPLITEMPSGVTRLLPPGVGVAAGRIGSLGMREGTRISGRRARTPTRLAG